MNIRLIPGQGSYANSYIAGNILVDAGVTPMAVEAYRDKIEYIVLTHCHFDHIAYLKELAGFCDAKVCIHKQDAEGLVNDQQSLSMLFGSHAPNIPPDILLEEGSSISDFTVLHTPGHTVGGICLYDTKDHNLISGDTVFTEGGYGRYDFPGGSLEQLIESIKRLSELDVTGLFPGHGVPVQSDGDKHIKAALSLITSGY